MTKNEAVQVNLIYLIFKLVHFLVDTSVFSYLQTVLSFYNCQDKFSENNFLLQDKRNSLSMFYEFGFGEINDHIYKYLNHFRIVLHNRNKCQY